VTRRHIAITTLVLALTATACGSEEKDASADPRDRIEVSGDFGSKPVIEIDSPLKVSETTAWTTEEGSGDRVGTDSTTILGLTLADARTGKTVLSTGEPGQQPLELSLTDQIFPALARSLVGKAAQTRVVVASTPEDGYGPQGAPQLGIRAGDSIVLVADVLATDPTSVLDGPTGASRRPPPSAPKVEESGGSPIGIDFAGLREPKQFGAITLREGTGPAIGSPDRIVADYVGQVWGAKKPFDNTHGKETPGFSVGLGGVIKCWDRGLPGLKEGARVMLICPPDTAYGKAGRPGIPPDSTLVFLIDVRGVG
jgi:peptidylprolyl isomerase